jgi:hypothetical protein
VPDLDTKQDISKEEDSYIDQKTKNEGDQTTENFGEDDEKGQKKPGVQVHLMAQLLQMIFLASKKLPQVCTATCQFPCYSKPNSLCAIVGVFFSFFFVMDLNMCNLG